MKIRGKVILTIGIMLAIILGLTSNNLFFTNKIRATYQEIIKGQEIAYLMKAIQFRITGISNDERAYLLQGDSQFTDEIKEKANEVNGYFAELTAMIEDPTQKDRIAAMKEEFDTFLKASEHARQSYQAGKREEAVSLHFGEERSARKALDEDVKGYIEELEQKHVSDLTAQASAESMMTALEWVITGVAVVLGVCIGVWLYRSIARPIQQVNLQMKEIAEGEGDLTKELQVKTQDEVGELSQSFNQMLANLRNLILQVRSNAEQVAASAEELTASAEQTSKATEQIADRIQDMAQGTEQQVDSVERGSRTISELFSTVERMADHAETTSATALQAAQMAHTGNEGMQTAVVQVGTVNQTMNHLTDVVKGLGVRSQEIGQIVDVISGIAAQTNLLALNAAIEAARAGEQGRGFSVVADEVRKLAEQSSQSASQIARQIAAIQQETADAVTTMESGKQEVTESIELVTSTGEIFAKIERSVQAVAEQIREVSTGSRHMAEGMAQVVGAIDQIAATTSSTASGSGEVTAATEEQLATMEEVTASAVALSDMADELQQMIGRFKV
ncbi:methyl-accepting chemotaxis protein [Brevibacillus dissolubilis]|uniref:methyl-accepting chemotaxis protein n=1 Tax=Brevibacillus dissolubilis TaxID=1844116 RepID=UPI0011178CB9|nr:methyl-accepting chemotaxis protein [Brevibacillus dissolubilis]